MPLLTQSGESSLSPLQKRVIFGNDCYDGDTDCNNGLSYGARAGIGIGLVALFMIIAAVIAAGIRRRRYQSFVNSSNPSANPGYSNPYASSTPQNQNPYLNNQFYGGGGGGGAAQPQYGANQAHYYPPPPGQPPKEGEEAFETLDGYKPAQMPPPVYQPPPYQPKDA